ncbi:MAG: hypothetical protein AB9891_21080 [Anaerolineaceae bacterium]
MLLAGLVVYIFLNPTSKLNPFPPPTVAATIMLPTFDKTLQESMGTITATRISTRTETPTSTLTPSATFTSTPEPTLSPTPSNNNSHNPATTPIPTKILNDEYPFILHGEPKMLDASTFNPKHTCNWQGIAGQTFDLLNRPLPGILVQVSGQLGNEKLEMISMSGTVLTYGDSGYEIFLANRVIESHETLSIRLIDEAGKPLSEQYKLDTSGNCNQNLVIVNFKKVK